jgi:hypothetical protein
MTNIEDQIRVVMTSQADAMRVPDARPGQQMARVIDIPTARRPVRLLMVAAAAVLVVVAVVALTQRRDGSSGVADPAAAGALPVHFETPTVVLDAGSVQVILGDQTFAPTADLRVESDPGTPNEYTTLELTWHEGGVEQRINMYFQSDGVDWWANEIRTYDGNRADWMEPAAQGQYFKSPLGTAYTGNVDLPNLRIEGMTLQAFRRPSACDNPTSPLALVADYPRIDSVPGGFGASFQVLDTATCSALPVASFSFEYTSDDPSVAVVPAQQEVIPDYPAAKTRIDIRLVAAGQTTIHAVARDAGGNIAGTADMHVTVRQTDEAAPLDTAAPPTTAR